MLRRPKEFLSERPRTLAFVVRVEWVGYGRPAADALRAAVSEAKAGDRLAPVTVVVPSNHVGVAARRAMARRGLGDGSGRGSGIAAVTFLTPYRLAEMIGAPRLAESGRRPVSTPVIAAAVRSALSGSAGMFAPVASHPATEAALVDAYRLLRDLSDDARAALSAASERAGEVVRICEAARRSLAGEWYDEEDLASAAAEAFGTAGAPTRDLGPLVVYLPQRLTRHAGSLLAAAASQLPLVVVAGATGRAAADGDAVRCVERLGGDATGWQAGNERAVVAADRTRFITCSDADDEVRAAVRVVLDAVRAGTPLDRIAVLYAARDPYARLVHEQLGAAGVRANGTAVVPLAGRVAGRTLLSLLDLPARRFRRHDVFAWLTGAPIVRAGKWTPTTAWERISREAAVVEGDDWDRRLARFATEMDEQAARADGDVDQPAWRAERARADAERARELRDFVCGLIDELSGQASSSARWAERAEWAQDLLVRLLGDSVRRASWPEAERRAAERVERALDRLGALDSIEDEVTLDVFTRTLALELDADLGRVGRLGEGVFTGPISMAAGLEVDLVILLGLVEGSFPAAIRDDSLLPDRDRAAARGELAGIGQRIDDQERDLFTALAGAGKHVLCVPRGDLRRSSERVPSRWAAELAGAVAGDRWSSRALLSAESDWCDHIPSFAAALRRSGVPATAQEHRLRSLLANTDRAPSIDDTIIARGAATIGARRSYRFTKFDGNLEGLDIASPTVGLTSATRLERWAKCPFAYLLGDLLHIVPVENPEDELQITPLDKGSLVHDVLEQFITEVVDGLAPCPDPDTPWPPAARERLQAIAREVGTDYEARGLTGRPIFWRRDRVQIERDLARFLDEDDLHRKARRTRPVAAELAFGMEGQDGVTLDLPDGRSICFRGRADRVDEDENGALHVVDYKTGRAKGYENLSADEPDDGGRKLQLPVYGVAARLHRARPDARVFAEYWFVSAKGEFRRQGFEIDADVLERFRGRLGSIVEGIEAGVFPARPTDSSTNIWIDCHFCDPDGLGVNELRRQWERKRSDPRLVPYGDMAEPIVNDEPIVTAEEVDGA